MFSLYVALNISIESNMLRSPITNQLIPLVVDPSDPTWWLIKTYIPKPDKKTPANCEKEITILF